MVNIKMLFIIIEEGYDKKIKYFLNKYGIKLKTVSKAYGTASVSVLNYFGLLETEKELFMAIIPNYLSNEILNKLKDNFGLDVMLYTSGNCTLSTTKDANILDLEEYHRLTGVENVWMPMPKQQSGEVGDRYKEYLQKFPKCMNLIMEQEVLDTTISNGAKIDIDTISKEEYINLLYRVLEKVQEKENGIEYER